jgi:uncharacterized protein YjiS (DUF1127 family)
MKQNLTTTYHWCSSEIALSATINAIFIWATMIQRIWGQRIKQRNTLDKLNARLLDELGISEAQRLAEINKPAGRI